VNDYSALTDEFKLGEDNSDPITTYPEFNCAFLTATVCSRPKFKKNSGREHANESNWHFLTSEPSPCVLGKRRLYRSFNLENRLQSCERENSLLQLNKKG